MAPSNHKSNQMDIDQVSESSDEDDIEFDDLEGEEGIIEAAEEDMRLV